MTLRIRQVIHQFDADGREYTLVDIVRPANPEWGETEDVSLPRMGRAEAEARGFTLEAINGAVAVGNMVAKELAEAARDKAVQDMHQAQDERNEAVSIARASVLARQEAEAARDSALSAKAEAQRQEASVEEAARLTILSTQKERDAALLALRNSEAQSIERIQALEAQLQTLQAQLQAAQSPAEA